MYGTATFSHAFHFPFPAAIEDGTITYMVMVATALFVWLIKTLRGSGRVPRRRQTLSMRPSFASPAHCGVVEGLTGWERCPSLGHCRTWRLSMNLSERIRL